CPWSQPAEIAGSSYAHCARERTVATIIACSSPSPRGEGRGGNRRARAPTGVYGKEARMSFFVVGLSHKTAPVELREQFAVNASNLVPHANRLELQGDLDEIVLLSTCNRVEISAAYRYEDGRGSSLLQSSCYGSSVLSYHPY